MAVLGRPVPARIRLRPASAAAGCGRLRINPGDQFFVNVVFTGPVDVNQFSFAGNWLDGAAVTEPATWAMMLLGLGVLGAAMRTRRQREALAIA